MTKKPLAIISYFTIIGWLFSYVSFKKSKKTHLLRYHLEQSLGIFLAMSGFNILLLFINFIMPIDLLLLSWLSLPFFILAVMGMINAANEAERPIPIVGKFFEHKFTFIQ
ncbi:DUF4870 domain-containing protein [Pedobacter sp. UYP30]|uniref:DUF4870 domain-containing protein n=1 Tax=Pedobacter sp. UYP30 TaxID=1756400 RepID=UPI00339332B2